MPIAFNTLLLETKFEIFRKKQHFLLHLQELNQGNLHYKNQKMSDFRNFLFRWKNIFISLDHYPKEFKFPQATENQKDMLWITVGFNSHLSHFMLIFDDKISV